MISRKKVVELAEERINELNNGLFIVDLHISSANAIQMELDKHTGNVTIDDCVSVSRNIEHNLDREKEDFELKVSSAGLDKPLRVLAQYIKNIGRKVHITLSEGTRHEGKLLKVNEKELILETTRVQKIEGKKKKEIIVEQLSIPMHQIKETKIVISF